MALAKPPNVDAVSEIQAAGAALKPAAKRLEKSLGKLDPSKLAIGSVADLLYDLRQTSQQLSGLTKAFDDSITPTIKSLEEYFIETLKADEASGVQGGRARVQVTDSPVPVVDPDGWPKIYAYIRKTGAWELLNRAVNRAAVKERWDAKKRVPGISVFHVKKVSCTKLGGK